MKKVTVGVVLALIATAMFLAISCDGGGTSTVQKDCVVMLGDSIFALSGEETEFLEDLSGHTYRTYYESGAQMGDPKNDDIYSSGCDLFANVPTIPEQYENAKNDDPNISTIIYDGGGNDVLLGASDVCSASYPNGQISADCYRVIDYVESINNALWADMAADGVETIVQQGYYYAADKDLWVVAEIFQNRTISEWNAFKANHPEVQMVYVDPRPSFDRNQADSYTIYDGIHPTTDSSEILANLLWDAMVANNIEQTDDCPSGSSSGGTGGCN